MYIQIFILIYAASQNHALHGIRRMRRCSSWSAGPAAGLSVCRSVGRFACVSVSLFLSFSLTLCLSEARINTCDRNTRTRPTSLLDPQTPIQLLDRVKTSIYIYIYMYTYVIYTYTYLFRYTLLVRSKLFGVLCFQMSPSGWVGWFRVFRWL